MAIAVLRALPRKSSGSSRSTFRSANSFNMPLQLRRSAVVFEKDEDHSEQRAHHHEHDDLCPRDAPDLIGRRVQQVVRRHDGPRTSDGEAAAIQADRAGEHAIDGSTLTVLHLQHVRISARGPFVVLRERSDRFRQDRGGGEGRPCSPSPGLDA